MFRRALLAVNSSMSAVSDLTDATASGEATSKTSPDIHRRDLFTQSEGRGDVIASSASAIDVVFDLSFVWHQQATSSDIEIWNKRRCVHVISMWDQVDCLHRLAALEHYYRPTVPTGKTASK